MEAELGAFLTQQLAGFRTTLSDDEVCLMCFPPRPLSLLPLRRRGAAGDDDAWLIPSALSSDFLSSVSLSPVALSPGQVRTRTTALERSLLDPPTSYM